MLMKVEESYYIYKILIISLQSLYKAVFLYRELKLSPKKQIGKKNRRNYPH